MAVRTQRATEGARVVVVRTEADAEPHLDAWASLERYALDNNVYACPSFVVPALRHLDRASDTRVALVYADSDGGDRMIGCLPLRARRGEVRLPFPSLSSCATPHGYVGLPLLDRRFPTAAAGAIFDWLDRQGREFPITSWSRIPLRSSTWAFLEAEAAARGRCLWLRDEFARPTLAPVLTFEARLAGLSKSRRKAYRRSWRKLEALGEVTVNVHRDLSEAPDIAARFIDLEGSGWKSEQNTALCCSAADTAFFTDVTANLGAAGRIFFVELQVDALPVAITANFVHGRTMFAFKVAYANRLAAISPGILAEIETLRAFGASALEAADSGSGPHSYLGSYWLDRQPIGEILSAAPGSLADGALRMLPVARTLKRSAARLLSA